MPKELGKRRCLFKNNGMIEALLLLYLPFIGWGILGWGLHFVLPKTVPRLLGLGLFWVGVPLVIFSFLHHADLSGPVWLAGMFAVGAVSAGLVLGLLWLTVTQSSLAPPAKGSFLLTATMGNTGYLGFPIVLALAPQYFGWAVCYDAAGTLWGNLGGAALASGFGQGRVQWGRILRDLAINPILWSFTFTLLTRDWVIPDVLFYGLQGLGWSVIPLTLVLLGMHLGEVQDWRRLQEALPALMLKIICVPLGVWAVSRGSGLTGHALEVIVLQSAMPSAFSSLLLSEAYGLDRELTAVTIALTTFGAMLTLPVWIVWLA
jgi:malate permease and related proteins